MPDSHYSDRYLHLKFTRHKHSTQFFSQYLYGFIVDMLLIYVFQEKNNVFMFMTQISKVPLVAWEAG